MRAGNRSATRRLGIALWIGIGSATPLDAHFPSPSDVVQALNAPEVKARMGIGSASIDRSVPRLLVVRVSSGWHLLPESERLSAAALWLSAWRHAQRRGIVAVVDDFSGKALVAYRTNGEVQLVPP